MAVLGPVPQVLASLAGLGVICTAVAFVAFLELIKEVGPTRSTVITYVNPAVAVAAGALFLGESLTVGIAVAFTLILAGSVLATAGASGGSSGSGESVRSAVSGGSTGSAVPEGSVGLGEPVGP